MSALLLHSQLNTWLQWVGQRQPQDKTRNVYAWGLGAPYIRELTVIYNLLLDGTKPIFCTNIDLSSEKSNDIHSMAIPQEIPHSVINA